MYKYLNEKVIGKKPEMLRSKKSQGFSVDDIFEQIRKAEQRGELLNVRQVGKEFPILRSTSLISERRFLGCAPIYPRAIPLRGTSEWLRNS